MKPSSKMRAHPETKLPAMFLIRATFSAPLCQKEKENTLRQHQWPDYSWCPTRICSTINLKDLQIIYISNQRKSLTPNVFCGHIFSARSMAKTTNLIYFFSYDQTLESKAASMALITNCKYKLERGHCPTSMRRGVLLCLALWKTFMLKLSAWVPPFLTHTYRSRNQILSTIK